MTHNNNPNIKSLLEMIANITGYNIVLINSSIPIFSDCVTTLTATGPAEWLWLIQNAEAIISSSFHGVAFSLIYNKPFFCVGEDTRKRSLLDSIGLSHRIIQNFKELPDSFENFYLDFKKANILLKNERERSLKLLQSALDICE